MSKVSPQPLCAAYVQRWLCGRLVPHTVAVKELVTAAMATQKALAAAMAAGRWSCSVAVQGVVVRTVFVGEGEVNAPWPHLLEVVACGAAVGATVARDAAVHEVNVRAVTKQGVLALAVALRKVFPATWTVQEVLVRAGAVQEVLVPTVLL